MFLFPGTKLRYYIDINIIVDPFFFFLECAFRYHLGQ